jgi:GNAT superfamily N-acetyltransferase
MTQVTIERITYEEIYPFWEKLWPGRDDIKPMSSMTGLDPGVLEETDQSIYALYEPVFFGATFFDERANQNMIIGVNSGHPTSKYRFRSRGLWVHPRAAGNGIGQALLRATCQYAQLRQFEVVWTFPRDKALKTYEAVGFKPVGEMIESEAYIRNGTMIRSENWHAENELNDSVSEKIVYADVQLPYLPREARENILNEKK